MRPFFCRVEPDVRRNVDRFGFHRGDSINTGTSSGRGAMEHRFPQTLKQPVQVGHAFA